MIIKLKADKICEGFMTFELLYESLFKQVNEQLEVVRKQIVLEELSYSSSQVILK